MEHSFDVELATKYGVKEAIIFKHIQFWVTKNEANGVHFYEGKTWTYNSVKAFELLFPYMTHKQIRAALDNLIEQGLIEKGNFNKLTYDRTTWYTVGEKGKCICPTGPMDLPHRANGVALQGQPIPDINTDNKNTDRRTDIYMQRHKCGVYKNVLLSDEDLAKLKEEFADYEERIERLSEYMESTGKKYKNHLATIRAWSRKDKKHADLSDFYKMAEEWANG